MCADMFLMNCQIPCSRMQSSSCYCSVQVLLIWLPYKQQCQEVNFQHVNHEDKRYEDDRHSFAKTPPNRSEKPASRHGGLGAFAKGPEPTKYCSTSDLFKIISTNMCVHGQDQGRLPIARYTPCPMPSWRARLMAAPGSSDPFRKLLGCLMPALDSGTACRHRHLELGHFIKPTSVGTLLICWYKCSGSGLSKSVRRHSRCAESRECLTNGSTSTTG
ncbi:hypothetical protein V8F33_003810 [Rhypophila sp. PSN 637]